MHRATPAAFSSWVSEETRAFTIFHHPFLKLSFRKLVGEGHFFVARRSVEPEEIPLPRKSETTGVSPYRGEAHCVGRRALSVPNKQIKSRTKWHPYLWR
jgi:hypothetical protein